MTLEEIEFILAQISSQSCTHHFRDLELRAQSIIDNDYSDFNQKDADNCRSDGHRFLAFALFSQNALVEAIAHAEKALMYAISTQSLEREVRTLRIFGKIYLRMGEYEKALDYFFKGLHANIHLGNFSLTAHFSIEIGNVHLSMSEYALAISAYNLAYERFSELNEIHDACIVLANLGSAYRDMGDYSSALEHYFKVIEILEGKGDKSNIATCLGNIGITYRHLGNYELAIDYLKKAVKGLKELGAIGGAAMFTGNIGITYSQMGNHVQSLRYLENAYETFKQLDQKVEIAQFAVNIGHEYYVLRNYDKALQYLEKYCPILKKLGRHEEATGTYRTIGYIYASPDFSGYDIKKAEHILLDVIESYSQLGAKFYLYQTHQSLAKLYKQQKRWEEYAEHIEKYHQLYIEVQNEEVKKQADRFGWEHKVIEMEKEKEIEKIKTDADKRLLEETINFQKLSIEQQSRELKNTIEELVRKNSLLQHIQSDIKKIAPHTIREGTEHIKQLLDRVDRNITPLESNQQLHNQLNEIHKDFMYNLHEKFLDLTTMELKIAALLSMKLTSSNIAGALFLSKRTVESHRLSLRKKMGLVPQDDIYAALSKYMK